MEKERGKFLKIDLFESGALGLLWSSVSFRRVEEPDAESCRDGGEIQRDLSLLMPSFNSARAIVLLAFSFTHEWRRTGSDQVLRASYVV